MGKDHATAAREGTDEIGLAVMATTFAIVAVFVPIAFMNGVIGRFFFQFGVTVAVAVLVSPVHQLHARPDAVVGVARSGGDALHARAVARPLHGRRSSAASTRMHVVYGRVLALGARASQDGASAIALVAFFASFAIVPLVGTEFMPQADQGFISLRLNTPVGSSLEYTDAQGARGRGRAEEVSRRSSLR